MRNARTNTPTKHIVAIFQENVSFDHYFGTYPDAVANQDGIRMSIGVRLFPGVERRLADMRPLIAPPSSACIPQSPSRSRVADAQGMELISTKPLGPGKRWSHYRIAPELFLEFRYDALSSAVAVMTVQSPHYP